MKLYKPVNYNGAHDLVTVGLHGHVGLGHGEVGGRDRDGVAADVIVLGWRRIDRHRLEQRTQHTAELSDLALRMIDNWDQEFGSQHNSRPARRCKQIFCVQTVHLYSCQFGADSFLSSCEINVINS